eukprot:TRINITY_DN10607_c0_g1_i1.p1 TRINITY_DN10607_c0_g1~~TRINITY_DN10607_c0_g1_i1.p1  ORF type:complete len:217 (+),score=36.62 TRINITY_DN10607_c0_g1_i1:44-694(+)
MSDWVFYSYLVRRCSPEEIRDFHTLVNDFILHRLDLQALFYGLTSRFGYDFVAEFFMEYLIFNGANPYTLSLIIDPSTKRTDLAIHSCTRSFTVAPGINKSKKRRKLNSWSKDESITLLNIIKQYGSGNWVLVAKLLQETLQGKSSKTPSQCAQHWGRVINPDINKGPWEKDELIRLVQLHDLHGNKWSKISREMKGRTDIQCRRRMSQILKTNQN